MKTALIATALLAVTVAAAPLRKPAFLAQNKNSINPTFAKVRAVIKQGGNANQWQIFYDEADYYIWDENQEDYAYKGRDGHRISWWDDNWSWSDFAVSKFGLNWEQDWRFAKFWWLDWCDTDGCEEKYEWVWDTTWDWDNIIAWISQWSDKDWQVYGQEFDLTREEFAEWQSYDW